MYDVVIPVAPKDYIKIPYCVESLKNLNPQPSNVYLVSKDKLRIPGTIWIDESTAIPIKVVDIRYHLSNWIYQQILKMTQDFSENDYLCIDSDLVINKTLNIYSPYLETWEVIPNYFISSQKQNHQPYFDFMEKVWGLKKKVDFSFISDITYFRKNILRNIIPSSEWILEKCNRFLSDDCLIGEPEIYGNYLATIMPDSYCIIDINVGMYGKYMPDLYTKNEIEEILAKEKGSNNDIVAIHSWT